MAFLKRIYHFLLALAGGVLYGFPSRKLVVIGVTGTKGKTTTTELIAAMLRASGLKTVSLSSAYVRLLDKTYKNPTRNTMPGRFFIQGMLAKAVRGKATHAVIEVTSQGVLQYRHRFIDFDVALITNLHPEHVEAHGSFEAYRAAKGQFFSDVALRGRKPKRQIFINGAMLDKDFFLRRTPGQKIVYFSKETFLKIHAQKTGDLSAWLRSEFNLENTAAAVSVGEALGIDPAAIHKTLQEFSGVPGRLEFVRGQINGQPRLAVIDYALTAESLEALYKHLTSELKSGGKLLAVFGSAGGGRDIWKRPLLGKIADRYCEKIYLTTDDPYDDDPATIAAEISAGIANQHKVKLILDRRVAIETALTEAKAQDIVAITGMGSQTYTYGPGGKKISWSERRVVEEILQN